MKNNFVRSAVQKFPSINWGKTVFNSESLILKWGENPFFPPQQVKNDIIKALDSLNRYPTMMNTLKKELSTYTGLPDDFICLTNGADKAFRLLAETFIDQGDEVITFTPSYPVIDSVVELMGGKMVRIPLSATFKIPEIMTIKTHINTRTKMIYVCNPNNPTSTLMATKEKIEALLKLGVIVIVDEAYFEISQITCQELMRKYSNLIILRSFSKGFGLAGLRVGYVLTAPLLTNELRKVEETIEIFNISSPSLAGAISALRNIKSFKTIWEQLEKNKKLLTSELQKMNFSVYGSLTTFILFDGKKNGVTATKLCEKLSQKNIYLKDCGIYEGLDKYKIYTAIPSIQDLPRLLEALKSC